MFGLDPDEQLVADAVRMSLSIPFYFEPVHAAEPGHRRGGHRRRRRRAVQLRRSRSSTAPTAGEPRWPTFGVRLLPDLPGRARRPRAVLRAADVARGPAARAGGGHRAGGPRPDPPGPARRAGTDDDRRHHGARRSPSSASAPLGARRSDRPRRAGRRGSSSRAHAGRPRPGTSSSDAPRSVVGSPRPRSSTSPSRTQCARSSSAAASTVASLATARPADGPWPAR